ncbi:MAG TPA: hypothetical protein VGC19_14555 [Rhodanobacter sp.]
MNESSQFFTDLRPPAGGLQRLHRTIHHPKGRAHRTGRLLVASAFAVAFLLLASLVPGIVMRHRQTAKLVSAMHAAVAPPANGIEVVDGAALELPSGQANVRLYLVQSNAAVPSGQNGSAERL